MDSNYFDIILPTYNNLDELKACLHSFSKQTNKDFNVLVCIDGSSDGTLEYLQHCSYSFDLKIITHSDYQNHGRPSARNLALSHVSASYILMLDTDLRPTTQLVEAYAKWFLQNPDSIAIGEVKYSNTNTNLWATYMGSRGKNKYTNGTQIPFQYLNTQNLAMPSKYFLVSNGLDPQIKGYGGDDTEWSYRLHQQFQAKFFFLKTAIAEGDMNKTLEIALKQMQEFGATSLKYIMAKHPEFKKIFQSERFNHWFLKMAPINLINKMALLLLKIPFKKLQMLCVHYLVFVKIRKGYLGY
jgi:glycosyltransferase involved in cell wall biosynthesis